MTKTSTTLLHLGEGYQFTDKTIPKEAAFGRVFIYVVLLNSADNSKHVPVFVDYTTNFKKRLSKHKILNWHNQRFNRPILIQVLGTIEQENAPRAAAELKQALIDNGFSYYKHVIKWGAKRVDTFTDSELEEYLSNSFWNWNTWVRNWEQKWRIKGKAEDKEQRAAKQREKDSQIINQKTSPVILEHFDHGLVKSFMLNRSYKNKYAVRVAQQATKTYNDKTGIGYYEVWLPSKENQAEYRQNEITQANKYISHDWQFISVEEIKKSDTGATQLRYFYRLTQPAKMALQKLASKPVKRK